MNIYIYNNKYIIVIISSVNKNNINVINSLND